MCKDPEAGAGAWCGEERESPGDSASQGLTLRSALGSSRCDLSSHLSDSPGRKDHCSVLQVGERRPPAWKGGALQGSVALGLPGGP